MEQPSTPAPGVLPTTRTNKAGEPFTVREFRPDDREALEHFYDEFEPKRAAQGLPPRDRLRVARWLDSILPNGTHLLAFRDDLIGHAMLVPADRPGMAEYAIFLRQDVRGRGVGTELNRVAVEVAREQQMRRLWLSVEPDNRAAIRSYEKVGYTFVPGTMYSTEAEMKLDL